MIWINYRKAMIQFSPTGKQYHMKPGDHPEGWFGFQNWDLWRDLTKRGMRTWGEAA